MYSNIDPEKKERAHIMAKNTFQWDDPLLLEKQLGEEERLIRDTARAYAQDRLAPRAIEAFGGDDTRRIWRRRGQLCVLRSDCPGN